MSDGADHLAEVRGHIAEAARAAGRSPAEVTLVAVSKTHGADRVRELLEVGHRVFGENRVQEAEGKFPELKAAFPDLELHLIGPLQTNKARDAVALFDVIQSVDRDRLAAALAKEMEKLGRRPACYIQVNTGEEPQKAGILPKDLDAFVALCRDQYKLPDRRPDVHPAGRRGAGAAFRAAGQDGRAQRPGQAQHGHERRLRDGRPAGRHPCPGRQRPVRRAAAAAPSPDAKP